MSLDKTSSGERLSFTVFLAVALHALVILGIKFTIETQNKVAPTLDITLATHQSDRAPDKADYLAQFDQEASGTEEESRELTTDTLAEVASPNVNLIAPPPQQRTTQASIAQQEYITATDSTAQIPRQPEEADSLEERESVEAQAEDVPALNPEIASLRARLDRLQQEYARRPRIRHLTSVATHASPDAQYLNEWTRRVEILGNEYFPQAALEQRIFGNLRMLVVVNADGSVEKVEILKPSGFPVLDQAALQIVRLASPFDPFPPEIRATTDQLGIIRTWRFEITGLSTGSSD